MAEAMMSASELRIEVVSGKYLERVRESGRK